MNHIQQFEGNLTRDPESRFTDGGTQVASFGLAVNERGREPGQERTIFFNVTAYKDLAANVLASVSKGDRVVVLGRLRSWGKEVFNADGKPFNVSQYGIDATDVSVSLLWATAKPVKTRSGTNDGNGARPEPEPAPAPYGPNEEPF